ncbi:MAG TPA: TetR/AcrR family transcriptional regulator [Gemmatimonadaceae bacterium]|nr:TetR/AcrR family transcriptional regulator [Gemmatimonadaceae bacterium]
MAREMFVRDGYEATTMRAIADRIEYTPTAIYHHFAGKRALLTELCTSDFDALAAAFGRIGSVADPAERLERIGAAYVNFAVDHPMQYQLLFMTRRPADDGAAAGTSTPGEGAYAIVRDCCAAGIAAGVFRSRYDDAEELAQICWGSLHGIVALHIALGDNDAIPWRDIRKTAARLSSALLRGLRKRGAGR